jgi:uncharacterized SAM-binding protein YcdF (DUF218 family)
MHSLFLHQALPLLVLPLGISLICLAAALRWRRRALIAAPLVLLAVFSSPLVADGLLRSLENRYPRLSPAQCPVADAVFPLGGILGPRFRPDDPAELGEAASRFESALEIYFAGRAPTLVLSAAWTDDPRMPLEGEVLRRMAIARGVPAGAIVVTGQVMNTAAEAVALRDIAAARHWRRVLLVTSAYHMFRATRLFRICPVEIVPVPVHHLAGSAAREGSIFWLLPQSDALSLSERALREYWGALFYRVTGRG